MGPGLKLLTFLFSPTSRKGSIAPIHDEGLPGSSVGNLPAMQEPGFHSGLGSSGEGISYPVQ